MGINAMRPTEHYIASQLFLEGKRICTKDENTANRQITLNDYHYFIVELPRHCVASLCRNFKEAFKINLEICGWFKHLVVTLYNASKCAYCCNDSQ